MFKFIFNCKFQKQSSRGVLKKRCAENMQQICRRTPMPKCDFNKVALQYGCYLVNLLHIFRTPSSSKTSGWLLLKFSIFELQFMIKIIKYFNKFVLKCIKSLNRIFWVIECQGSNMISLLDEYKNIFLWNQHKSWNFQKKIFSYCGYL